MKSIISILKEDKIKCPEVLQLEKDLSTYFISCHDLILQLKKSHL